MWYRIRKDFENCSAKIGNMGIAADDNVRNQSTYKVGRTLRVNQEIT
jgi:hypothetical protein